MATASPGRYAEQLREFEVTHPCWTKQFAESQRSAMVDEDLMAGKTVAMLLVAVVSLGLFAITVTLLAVLAY